MYERGPVEKVQPDLDSRLAAYYGPELREQSLPESTWRKLRSSLDSPRASRRPRLLPRWHISRIARGRSKRRSSKRTPAYIQHTFMRILRDSRMPLQSARLQYTLARYTKTPRVRIAPFRGKIQLVLSSSSFGSIDAAALDVLLATALARYYDQRKPFPMLMKFLLVFILLGCIGTFLYFPRTATILWLLIAIIVGLSLAFVGVSRVRGYALAFRADMLVVQWMGRTRVCQGLHMLANQERSQWWRRWREPSLAERIERVCGSRVAEEDEQLTLVR